MKRKLHIKRLFTTFVLMLIIVSCDNGYTNKHNILDNSFITYDYDDIQDKEAKKEFKKGLNQIENQNYKKAREHFNNALKIENKNPLIINALANSEYQLGNNELAIELLEHAIFCDSNYLETYVNYGVVLNTERRYEDAKKIMFKALNDNNYGNFYKAILSYNLACSFWGLKDCNNALSFARRAKSFYAQPSFIYKVDDLIREIQEKCFKKL